MVFTILAAVIPLNRPVDMLAIIAGLVTLLTVFVFQEKKETFTGWETDCRVLLNNEAKNGLSRSTTIDPAEEKPIAPFLQSDYEKIIQNYDLTARETEILVLILKGRNNPFIREKLNISPNTLKFHLRNIYHKFAVKDRQDLLSLFLEKI